MLLQTPRVPAWKLGAYVAQPVEGGRLHLVIHFTPDVFRVESVEIKALLQSLRAPLFPMVWRQGSAIQDFVF